VTFRVSPPRVFPRATRSAKPPIDAAGSADAYRQTSFVLGAAVDLVVRGLNLEGAVAEASSGAKHRNQVMASALGLWSRSWLARLEALHAMEWGNYVAAIALIRAATDYAASELYVLGQDAAEWKEWLDQGGIALAPEQHATEYRLHAFRAAEVLAAHAILGPIYRTTMDLSMPHFGSTLLVAGSDSTPERVLMTFGDRDFHLGLAEIVAGWLLLLSVAELEAAQAHPAAFGQPEGQDIDAFVAAARLAAVNPEWCRVEPAEVGFEKRYLVQNWRRQPGAAQKRILM
jgi:hypothetical protein